MGQEHLYGGRVDATTNIGTTGWVNVWNPAQVPSDGMSLSQLAVLCRGADPNNTMEAVEFGVQRNQSLYSDTNVHMFTYFRTAGTAEGDNIGGYNLVFDGFVPYAGAGFAPGATVPAPYSTTDGTQYERRLRATFFEGNWWVQDYNGVGYTWLGYYPGSLFNLLDTDACEALWFGEVADPSEADLRGT